MIQTTTETHRKQMKCPEGLISDLLLNNIHSSVMVVTPGELAGHLVLLEIRLSTDQCNTCVRCRGVEERKQMLIRQGKKNSSPPPDIMLVKVAAGCTV